MDVICSELGISKKQIKPAGAIDRYILIAKKSWLKDLVQMGRVSDFPVHPGLDEWPSINCKIGNSWCKTHIQAYKKQNTKVIPLPRFRIETQNDNDTPLLFSQLLHYVGQSNHKNMWKSTYKQYSGSSMPSKIISDSPKKSDQSIVFLPYENVLREVITRIYGCKIIDINDPTQISAGTNLNSHVNLYPALAAIETKSQIILLFDTFIEHSLFDCITYSPAILEKSHNKPLFLIYQLLHLMKSLHDKGLLLGDITLNDIFITENLWLQIIPRCDANVIKLEEIDTFIASMPNKSSPTRSGGSAIAESPLLNPNQFHTKYLQFSREFDVPPRYSVKDYCEMWCHGQISNFDYLTILNNLAGRRIGCPGYHHIMPWVTDFTSRNGMNWRDLTKSKYRLNKGDAQLDLMFSSHHGVHTAGSNSAAHHVSDVLSEITYYVYMARRTPKSVLCRHVRPIWVPAEYPASIQRLQEWTPDECIPEFYNDALVFKSIHEDLPDLEVPVWASCPENFITKHREALESQYVSERLHYWIDLTFGYKLAGQAAIKAKNVCLPLVDDHKNLSQRGVVQLFRHPHPSKNFQTMWTSKLPPRIYPSGEIKRRLTRSSEDLSVSEDQNIRKLIGLSDVDAVNMERSTSSSHMCAINSQKQGNANVIVLPKDFNPIAKLQCVENMEAFMGKSFYHTFGSEYSADLSKMECRDFITEYSDANGFTNRIFTDNFEVALGKSDGKNFKQIIAERRFRELQILGCLIVEMFLLSRLRPMNGGAFKDRFQSCLTILKVDANALPKCVQYPVKLLLQNQSEYEKSIITEKGLPNPSAHQLLQPLLSNSLFPFPLSYIKIYACIKSLHQFTVAFRSLNLLTFFECDGKNCSQYEEIDKMRVTLHRKIAECKVKTCVTQIEGLLDPIGFEQFAPIELLLPHIIDLIRNDDTSIMSAWYSFEPVAMALGVADSQKYLLEPILQLYDAESNERINFLNSNFDSSMKFTTSAAFKCKKSYKLYHHTFLLKLIVRFGLKCFLENFVAPLIEGVGGYKDPDQSCSFHGHENSSFEVRKSRSAKNFNLNARQDQTDDFSEQSKTLISPTSDRSSDKTLSPNSEKDDNSDQLKTEEIFDFESENDNMRGADAGETILQIIDNFDVKSESTLDLCLNHSHAEEMTEDTPINDESFKISDVLAGEDHNTSYKDFCQVNLSFDEDVISFQSMDSPQKSPGNISGTTPSLPIPANFIASREFSTIGCEIGSKKSIDSSEIEMNASMTATASSISASTPTKSSRPSRISEMSSESLIWLSHRLGPVLTARYLSRNLLKMLTLCYVGQENLFPESKAENDGVPNIQTLSIADGRVVGDLNATKVLECLMSISALFGEQFILLQYFPHVSELIALCKKRITISLEGGLISSLQLLKYLVSYLSDATIMDQLHDVILRSIIHPIIRLLGSSRSLMPSGFLSRNVLARKLIDTLYVLAIRIGPEMTREHLCVPALQRFFYIFNKAYGLHDDHKILNAKKADMSPNDSADETNFVEIRRDGGIREWSMEAGSPIKFKFARPKNAKNSFDSITPPTFNVDSTTTDVNSIKERAMDEIRDVFTPSLAFTSYLTFLKFLGENVMVHTVKNLPLILNLCHDYEQPNNSSSDQQKFESTNIDIPVQDDANDHDNSSSFGTSISVIGNRIDVQPDLSQDKSSELLQNDILNMVTYKLEQANTVRHLRGNWLAYWEHEIGRPDKDNHFNLKQIKLQSFHGHTNSVRAILTLDNENSFMSASKDKTVKLWSLRSEGDGSKVTQCQFTYTNHKKSVHSLTFLESHRLTISCDSGVHLWDPFVGAQISQLDSPRFSPVTVVKTIPAPSSLVICGTADASIKTIDTRTFTYINEWKISSTPTGSVRCMAISPQGSWISIGLSSGQITIIDAKSGIIIASWKANDGELLQLVAPNEQQLISSSLDHSISVWSSFDGSLLFQMKSPPEPAHCLIHNNTELITGTPANRIGVYSSISHDANYSITKLRSENFRGVLTTLAVLPLNRMLLIGGDSGNISLLC